MWVLLWGDDVAVLQPDDVRQGVSHGFNSQLHQSALLHSDVPQLFYKLRSSQTLSSCGSKENIRTHSF